MSDFKKQLQAAQAATPRVAIPQIDPETPKADVQVPVVASVAQEVPEVQPDAPVQAKNLEPSARPLYLTPVDTSEQTIPAGTHMYPSRRKQLKDLSYHTGKKVWNIVDDALEEYVTKHYGKEHKRQ